MRSDIPLFLDSEQSNECFGFTIICFVFLFLSRGTFKASIFNIESGFKLQIWSIIVNLEVKSKFLILFQIIAKKRRKHELTVEKY